MYAENRNVVGFGHALFGVFVSEDGGTSGVEGGVVIGMVEMPVGVDGVFQGSIAEAVESFFELGPGWRNEIIDDEFAVWAGEDHDVSTRAGEQGEILGELLRLNGSGTHLGAKAGGAVGWRLRREGRNGGAKKAGGEELRQEGAACEFRGTAQHIAAGGLFF